MESSKGQFWDHYCFYFIKMIWQRSVLSLYQFFLQMTQTCFYPGLNNSIGPIARDCPKWPSGKSICVLSCPPDLDGWTFGQPIFSVPNYRSPSTLGALYFEWFHKLIFVSNNRDLYQFCPWSHIQLIVYVDNIISIALIPVLKYWWRRANNTAAPQVVMKGVLLHFSITSSVIRDKVHHCEIPNALAMKIQQSCHEKRFLRIKDLWNLNCGGAGGNKKPMIPPALALEIPQPYIVLFNAIRFLYGFTSQQMWFFTLHRFIQMNGVIGNGS